MEKLSDSQTRDLSRRDLLARASALGAIALTSAAPAHAAITSAGSLLSNSKYSKFQILDTTRARGYNARGRHGQCERLLRRVQPDCF
jgi:hypothetical protein